MTRRPIGKQWIVIWAATATVLGAAGLPACGSKHHGASATVPTAGPSTSAAPPSTSAPTSSAPGPACSNLSVISRWPADRRAALTVVAPVLDFDARTIQVAASAQVGGILFLGTAQPGAGLAATIAAARQAAEPPMLVMADEEGGGIQRLAGAVTPLPWPRNAALDSTPLATQQLAATAGREMKSLGVNVDLAPVLDLDAGPGPSATNPDGRRSYSADPAVATRYGLAFANGLESAGVIPVVKHFPGLGGSSGNTDYGPASTRPLASLEAADLQPFRAAIAAGIPAVMVANASVPGLTTLPASVSSAVVNRLLRTTLGFRGLVLTDSLSAGAIASAGYGVPQAAVAAIRAGADMILFGSTLTPAETALLSPANVSATVGQIVTAITGALRDGSLTPARLDDAVVHVLTATHTNLCGGTGT